MKSAAFSGFLSARRLPVSMAAYPSCPLRVDFALSADPTASLDAIHGTRFLALKYVFEHGGSAVVGPARHRMTAAMTRPGDG